MSDATTVDTWRYTARWPVRQYELDQFGHVNNAVYLNWIEQVATVRGLRRTEIHRESDGVLMTEADTIWVWVRVSDGRPARIPAHLLRLFER